MSSSSTEAAFWSSAVIKRQYARFHEECKCTKLLHADYAQRLTNLERVVMIDGTGFRWEGLGNSGTRWMGLLRWGYATGRATFLRIARDERTMELGEFFTGWDGVDWNWGSSAARVRKSFALRGIDRPTVFQYRCQRRAPHAPGCQIARLTMRNGTELHLDEPAGLLRFMRDPASPRWMKIVLVQQDSIEFSYSKPEALRQTLPLTKCPAGGDVAFRSRELALKCETFAFMQPRPVMMAALLPMLRRLEPYQTIIGVHLRTGYADWAFRNDDSYFVSNRRAASAGELVASPPPPSSSPAPHWSVEEHWRQLDSYFRDCRRGQDGPCFNWHHPRFGHAPRREDGLRCGGATAAHLPPLWTRNEAPRGFLSALLLCASRLGQTFGETAHAGSSPSWGLLVLSDSPAFPSLAAHLPALRGRVVSTAGAGQLGHSSFSRSCSTRTGCSKGRDPGGAWTRSLVDFYLAGAADGFVKGLFTSFLFSTMRRNLLCCKPGAFVQWMAWYNLSRSHRDLPMRDRGFMAALSMEHAPPMALERRAAGA